MSTCMYTIHPLPLLQCRGGSERKPINYTLVTPTSRAEEQKPKIVDIKVNYETVDHLKTEEVRPILCVHGEAPLTNPNTSINICCYQRLVLCTIQPDISLMRTISFLEYLHKLKVPYPGQVSGF